MNLTFIRLIPQRVDDLLPESKQMMRSGRHSKACIWPALIAVAYVLAISLPGLASVFQSFNGRFHISYPENWIQVDYTTADYHMRQSAGGSDFEAIFASTESFSIFSGPYLVLTVDTTERLTDTGIDSLLDEMSIELGRELIIVSPEQFLADPADPAVLYSPALKTAALISTISSDSAAPRINLLVNIFYEHGIAGFYFYSPDSLFEKSLPVFKDIVSSFTVGRPKSSAGGEKVRIVDVESRRKSPLLRNIALFGGAAVIIIVLVILTRKRGRTAPPTG